MLATPHAHDLVYYVLGPARSVAAHMATRVNPTETQDCVTASLEMADGSLCAFAVTTGSTAELSRHRFYDALRSGGELPVTLADARAAIELCTALYHAARTREPVSLPIAADHPLYGGWQPRARP